MHSFFTAKRASQDFVLDGLRKTVTFSASLPLRGACTPSASEGRSSGVKVSSISETDEVSLFRKRSAVPIKRSAIGKQCYLCCLKNQNCRSSYCIFPDSDTSSGRFASSFTPELSPSGTLGVSCALGVQAPPRGSLLLRDFRYTIYLSNHFQRFTLQVTLCFSRTSPDSISPQMPHNIFANALKISIDIEIAIPQHRNPPTFQKSVVKAVSK